MVKSSESETMIPASLSQTLTRSSDGTDGTVRGTEQGVPAVWAAACLLGCHPAFQVMWSWAQLWLGVCLLGRLRDTATVAAFRGTAWLGILKARGCLRSAVMAPASTLRPALPYLCQENSSARTHSLLQIRTRMEREGQHMSRAQ